MLWLSVVSVFKISSQLKSSKNYLTLLHYFSATSGQAEFKTCFNRIGVAQFSVFSALSTIVCFFVLFCPVYCRSFFDSWLLIVLNLFPNLAWNVMAITAKSQLIFDEREILLYLNFLSFVSAITHQREYISD